MTYRHLNDDGLHQWTKSMAATKGDSRQREFLDRIARATPDEFVRYIERNVGSHKNPDGEIPSLMDPSTGEIVVAMTAGHMYLMPAEDIQRLYKHWQDIPYEEAICPTFWGSVTLAEIQAERIRPVWLAADHRGDESSTRRDIEKALQEDNAKAIDTLVRRCLRWMTAPGVFRGAPELYGNCSLAKAWWCGYFSDLVSTRIDGDFDGIVESLQKSWLGVTDYLAGKLTVISEPNVLAGLSLWARDRLRKDNHLQRKQVEHTCRMLGEISSWCVLGLAPAVEVEKKILDFSSVGNQES